LFKILKAGKFTILAILIVLLLYAYTNRGMLSLKLFALTQGDVVLGEMYEEKEGVRWYDDYFTIEYIDAETIAIGEPRYWQANYNYLILGETRAILFDSGPGVRDIAPVINSLTTLPVTVVSSHLHFDHVGNHGNFSHVALIDLPHLRVVEENGDVQLDDGQHLVFLEEIPAPVLHVSEWWKADEILDIGGRKLKVIYAPGHTSDSIVLYDAERRQLFTGDYIYPGPLFAYLPDSSLEDYLNTTNNLLGQIERNSVLLTAHRMEPPGAPLLNYVDLEELQATLRGIKDGTLDGEGLFPVTYRVNDHIQLLTDISWQ
jgi:hydroxyacylglutathione hydrolase